MYWYIHVHEALTEGGSYHKSANQYNNAGGESFGCRFTGVDTCTYNTDHLLQPLLHSYSNNARPTSSQLSPSLFPLFTVQPMTPYFDATYTLACNASISTNCATITCLADSFQHCTITIQSCTAAFQRYTITIQKNH